MSLFERILVGVDGSEAGLDALRQAKRLVARDGSLLVATVYDPTIAPHAGWGTAPVLEQLEREALEAKADADRELEGVENAETRVISGSPTQRLLALARAESATLVAVGSHGRSRAAGILVGGVATTLLHEAPCPVLLARPVANLAAFPRTIVVGVDGSPESLAAAQAAGDLAERFDASLRGLAATGGKPVDVDGLVKLQRVESELAPAAGGRGLSVESRPALRIQPHDWSERPPVEALVTASAEADLLVLGSRGLHGFAALGSVSERVAHRAQCSVLVVRPS